MALTQVKTSGLADDAVTGAKIADDTVAEANMANDAISLAELKAGTDGQIITYDASGNPVAVGPGTDGQVLTSTGAGSPPAFEALPASNNYTHPNHSGEVTSTADGAQVIADDVVDEANLKISNSPTNGYALTAQSGNTGGLTWAEIGGGLDGVTTGSGNVTITDGDLIIGTSGHGISFAATSDGTTMSSELLADYEEGTYTPTMNDYLTLHSDYDTASYIKIGTLCHVRFELRISNVFSNRPLLVSLPFQAAAATDEPYSGSQGILHENINSYSSVSALVQDDATNIQFYGSQGGSTSSAGRQEINNSILSTSSALWVSISYRTAS